METKDALDAFAGTDLDSHLRGLGVQRLVLAGLSAAHGIIATARTAVATGYDVTVASDATASPSAQEHTGALADMTAMGVRLSPVAEFGTVAGAAASGNTTGGGRS